MNRPKNSLNTVVKIMQAMVTALEKENGQQTQPSVEIIKKLMRRGYDPEDIDTAMRWLTMISSATGTGNEPTTTAAVPPTLRDTSHRHLHASEAIRLTPEAQRLLITMLEKGAVSPQHLERTLQYLWQNDLREVNPLRLEMILDLVDPNPQPAPSGSFYYLSRDVPPPAYIN